MAISNFLRDVWSANILRLLRIQAVWADLGTREYEPEFIGARQVRINAVSEDSVTVKDYVKDTDIDAPEELDDSQIVFPMDKQKYFNFQVDDLDAAQTNANLLQAGNMVAAEAVTRVVEQDVANTVVAAIPDANIITLEDQFKDDGAATPGVPKNNSALGQLLVDQFTGINVQLYQDNVKPTLSPWAVHGGHTWGALVHRLSGSGQSPITVGLTREVLENGFRGRLHDIEHFESNIEPVRAAGGAGFATTLGQATTTTTSAMNGLDRTIVVAFPGAFAHAGQIETIIPYTPEKRFGDAVRGLYVYGTVVLRPSLIYAIKFTTT